jgi:hypothetical protein
MNEDQRPPPPAAAQTAGNDLPASQSPHFYRDISHDLPSPLLGRPAHNKGKPYVSKRLKTAIDQVARGKSITEAAEITGMSRSGLQAALGRPHCVSLLESMIRAALAASAGKAAQRLDTLIDGARSEYVQLEASKAVLDRAGYGVAVTSGAVGDVVIQISL